MLNKILNLFRPDTNFGARRSSDWKRIRRVHLKLYPCCAVTGTKKKCEVHHILPFHLNPELELEPSNLITLSGKKILGVKSHQFFGHHGNFKLANPNVVEDAKMWYIKLRMN